MRDGENYPRDMIGYGRTPPFADWPKRARIAVQFVVNYEEGGENNILHGDAASEAFLSEIVGAAPWPGMRHMNMESIYEYGSRAGFWRLHRLFTERSVPVTVYAVATAMARNREAVAAMNEARWEIATHGLKWVDYRDTPPEIEALHIAEAVRIHTEIAGARPLGFYQGRSSLNTVRLGMEEGGFVYCAGTNSHLEEYVSQGEQPTQRLRDEVCLPMRDPVRHGVAPAPARYGPGAVTFHWTVAALIVFLGGLGLLFDDIPRGARPFWINVHVCVGLIYFAAVIARVLWRTTHKAPDLRPDIGEFSRRTSFAVHHLLYVLMLLIPVVGVVARVWHGRGFDYGVFQLDFGAASDPAVFHLAEKIHQLLAYALFALAGLHAAGALYHQFVRRDGILLRMMPGGTG